MYPYLIAILCLMNFAVLTFNELRLLTNYETLRKIELQHENVYEIRHSLNANLLFEKFFLGELSEKDLVEKTKNESSSKHEISENINKNQTMRSLDIDFSRFPNNSRINLYAFLNEPSEIRYTEGSWYKILGRFLRNNYLSKDGFPIKRAGLEWEILDHLLLKKEEIFEKAEGLKADVLGILTFENSEIAEVMYFLLTGFEDTPSILNYLDYDVKKLGFCKLNFLFADPIILQAVINHEEAFVKLKEVQRKFLAEIQEREEEYKRYKSLKEKVVLKNRTNFKAELNETVSIILTQYSLLSLLNKKLFDFSLGKSGDYIFLSNPETGWITRYRCVSKRS